MIEPPFSKELFVQADAQEYIHTQAGQPENTSAFGNLIARASRVVYPYYLGLSTAASHYGLSMQQCSEIFVLTTARSPKHELEKDGIRIVHQASNRFFGYQSVNVLGRNVMISDCEKTVIDYIDHLMLTGGAKEAGNILTAACQDFDWIKIVGYLEQIGSISLIRRFGWFVDYFRADIPPYMYDHLTRLAGFSRKTSVGSRMMCGNAALSDDSGGEPWRLWLQQPQRPVRPCMHRTKNY